MTTVSRRNTSLGNPINIQFIPPVSKLEVLPCHVFTHPDPIPVQPAAVPSSRRQTTIDLIETETAADHSALPAPPSEDQDALIARITAAVTTAVRAELKDELLEEVKKDFKEDMKAELRNELKDELKKELREELKAELSEEISTKVKADLVGSITTEVRGEINTVLNEGMKRMKKELKKEVYDDLLVKFKADISGRILGLEKMMMEKYKVTYASPRLQLPFPNVAPGARGGTTQTHQQRPPSHGISPNVQPRRLFDQMPQEKQTRRKEDSSQEKEQERKKQRRHSPTMPESGTSSFRDASAAADKGTHQDTSKAMHQDRTKSASAEASQSRKDKSPPPSPKKT